MVNNKKYVELLWADKYDKYQKGEKIPIEKPNLPFQVEGKEVTLKITDFQLAPTAELAEIASKVKDSRELIDYWAIDWDYKGDTFHNQVITLFGPLLVSIYSLNMRVKVYSQSLF